MTALDTAVIWLNLLGCLGAVAANGIAAYVGFLIHRGLAITIAVIAAMYAVGYGLLLTGAIELAKWSAFYRGVSIVVWPLVWAGPAVMSVQAWRHTRAQVEQALAEGVGDARAVSAGR